MQKQKGSLQHTTPMLVDELETSGSARALERVSFDSAAHNENFIQDLIFCYPQLLPIREIEPAFGRPVSVCTELPTGAGSVDNVFVTETGNLAIAECKLWRNPEARRQVLVQIIDYAHSLAEWTYQDLENAIRSSRRPDRERVKALYSLVSDDSDLDEPAFVDTVSRNLRLGRVMLLMVGDGIREGVETLADYLQIHAGFHFALGMVEMAVFKVPTMGFLVQPRVIARTVNIERGIVRLEEQNLRVEPSESNASRATHRTSISQDQLFERLSQTAPSLPKALRHFLEISEALGVFLEPASKSLQLRWRGPDDVIYALGGIDEHGRLLTNMTNWKPSQIGRLDLSHAYLGDIAALINGDIRQTKKPAEWYVVKKGVERGYSESLPDAMDLLGKPDKWLGAIQDYTEALSSAIDADSG